MKEKNELYIFVKQIKNKQDFEHFLNLLYDDFKQNKEEWENNELNSYLEALCASNANTTEEELNEPPSWRSFGEILLTAIVYE